MTAPRAYAGIDYFRMVAAFLIVAIHTAPLSSVDETASFVFTHILARVAVPFFLMITGYFLLAPIYASASQPDTAALKRFAAKTALLYGAAILLYLPINIYAGHFADIDGLYPLLKTIAFDGTMYHLWYLPASIIGAGIVYVLLRRFKPPAVWALAGLLYLIGLGGDSYYGLAAALPPLAAAYDVMFTLFDYTRNGLFYAPIFLLLGAELARPRPDAATGRRDAIGLGLSLLLLLAEGLLLHGAQLQRHDSMYIFLLPTMYFLFSLLLTGRGQRRHQLRAIALLIYLLHPLVIVIVRGMVKLLDLPTLLIANSAAHYLLVCLFSWLAAGLLLALKKRLLPVKARRDSRAWIEINLDHLRHNAQTLQALLPPGGAVMAVVKADAYGHGAVKVARALNRAGIKAFAVATVAEAVHLRRQRIKGDILILGPTAPADCACLTRYRLTQTVTDRAYAQALNAHGSAVRVHIKLDTGMHRLGESYDHLTELQSIFACRHLKITGTYTHLSCADRRTDEDMAFTRQQIECFYHTVEQLRQRGCDPGALHIQSSYGLLNYPELPCAYARIGIALYGVLSTADAPPLVTPDIKPVLALKARVTLTRAVAAGDAVGYGRQFIAPRPMTIAVASIGYADGIPRHLSAAPATVLLRGRRAPIIGRICMDQMMIDVSEIEAAAPGDIVTLIGRDGDEEIRCEELAAHCHTLTNEILSRLGARLK